MDIAKELVLNLKQTNISHAGYGLQKECESLIGHILQNMVKSQFPELIPEVKNEEDSIHYREEGNQHFVMGDDNEAIKYYTMSLAYANDNELMSYAYANRSAALYRKQMFKECLIDIDAALSLGYPEEKRKNLKERGAKAIEEIKKRLQLTKDDHIDIETLKNMCLSEKINEEPGGVRYRNGKVKLSEDTSKNFSINEKKDLINDSNGISKDNDMEKRLRYLADEGPLKLAYGPSKEAPAASDGISISFSEKYGRHLVATKEFKPGDVVTIENPYAYVIYTQRYYTHCHHCLSRSYNLIPCSHCPVAQYCSEKCRKLAWEMAHQIECPIMALVGNLLNVDKDKIRMLTKIIRFLIVVTSKGKKFDELRVDMELAESNPDNRSAGFTDEGILDSTSARSALSLATNMTTRPLIGISAFACISALAAILLATQTNFFCNKYEVDQLKDISNYPKIIFSGSLMFRACVIMSSNCFSVQQEPGIKTGSGLYVTHSLYNHSCAPNTFRHFEELTMITRALRPIYPGDQIFTNYGAAYAYMTKSERREKIIQDYFFECDCIACAFDWPTYDEILQKHIGSIKKNKELVERLKPYKQRLVKNMYDIDAVKSVLDILYKKVSQPCEEIVHAEQYLKSYYLGKFK
ncbi:SET and MYND domain-containing protein 4-like isoform X1 [Bombus affinis]|uniref:SET and MYND domain-containing protein 4-like isoform X1 n=1 Tax=Bombus affinis TaxID=309941 RepID=UPI0021B73F4E|nr:SET and MYND domain-containing protein 4-like isoform X1 [Bombus affinis]XP_050582515.1 SET and MYND domain-containing protein 4-like isoform X1 [Bombus affinis]